MREFQNGLIFLNLAKQFQRYLNFIAPKREFFMQNLKSTYISGLAPKRRFLMIFFQFSGNKHSKLTQNLKMRTCFMQNFMKFDMKKLLIPKL